MSIIDDYIKYVHPKKGCCKFLGEFLNPSKGTQQLIYCKDYPNIVVLINPVTLIKCAYSREEITRFAINANIPTEVRGFWTAVVTAWDVYVNKTPTFMDQLKAPTSSIPANLQNLILETTPEIDVENWSKEKSKRKIKEIPNEDPTIK